MNNKKVLIVGDLHATPEELGDCSLLVEQLKSICQNQNITDIWWTGDQHHTHSVLRVEVLHWFKAVFKGLRDLGIRSTCLVGNHDQAAPGSAAHSMVAYQHDPGVCVVDAPKVLLPGVLAVPYFHTQEEFLKATAPFAEKVETLFCHQTFDGSTYENGFLASDGFDAYKAPGSQIISGHIHTGQEFGKVWYVGSPRWRTLSDANTPRNVWVVEFNSRGTLAARTPFATVCRQIQHREDLESSPVQLPLDRAHQWRIDIKGSPEWCQRRKTELAAAGALVRTFPDQVSTAGRVRESEGISKAFQKYLGMYQPKNGTSPEVLQQMARERLSV